MFSNVGDSLTRALGTDEQHRKHNRNRFGYYRILTIRIITVRVVMQRIRVRRGNGTVPTENGT